MRSPFVVVPLVALALAGSAPAQDARANAAVKYLQAFCLMPALDKDQEKIVHEWEAAPLDAAAAKVVDQSRGALDYLHRGSKLTHCDWGLEYEDGIRLLLPHASKARLLAQLAALRARSEFEKGDAKAGVADVVAVLNLARHLQTDPIMIDQDRKSTRLTPVTPISRMPSSA